MRDQLENKWLPFLENVSLDDSETKIQKPAPLPWYPDKLAWHMEISKRELKKNPKLSEFHKWFTRETEAGHISRQETVSMIPVFFMDIQVTVVPNPNPTLYHHTSESIHSAHRDSSSAATSQGPRHVRCTWNEDDSAP